MVSESLQSLSSLYITSCGIEGKSPDTLRSYTETLKLFMRAVERLGLVGRQNVIRIWKGWCRELVGPAFWRDTFTARFKLTYRPS